MLRVASLDFGLKRIGVALSDPMQIIATPLPTIESGKTSLETAKKILESLKEYSLEEIVIGRPLNLNGSESFLSDEVSAFTEILKTLTKVPIKLWDERLTSKLADRVLKQASFSRKKRSQKVDSVSAVIILQSYLDLKGSTLLKDA